MSDAQDRPPYFVELGPAPKFTQLEGLETTVLTGLHGEQMMMVLNATLPGHSVPTHSHPHEQIGMVYSGRAVLRTVIGVRRQVQRVDTAHFLKAVETAFDTLIEQIVSVDLDAGMRFEIRRPQAFRSVYRS